MGKIDGGDKCFKKGKQIIEGYFEFQTLVFIREGVKKLELGS